MGEYGGWGKIGALGNKSLVDDVGTGEFLRHFCILFARIAGPDLSF